MTCPCCGCRIETSQERHQARMRARGLCVTCGKPTDADHYQCHPCRVKRSQRERARYRRQTIADLPEQRR